MAPIDNAELDDILCDFARQAQKDYPVIRDAFLLIDSRRWKAFQRFDISKFDGLTQEVFEEQKQKLARRAAQTKGSFSMRIAYTADGKDFYVGGFIAYGRTNNPNDGLSSTEKRHQIYSTLYHELGHLVVKDAGDDHYAKQRTYAESIADVYSLIRLHKDFGADVCIKQATALIEYRTELMLGGENLGHFTVPAVRAFLKDMDKIDFNTLTLEDAGELARGFALNAHIHENAADALSRKFNDHWRDRGTYTFTEDHNEHVTQKKKHDALEKLVEKVLSDKDIHFTQAANIYLHRVNAAPQFLSALRLHEIKLEKEACRFAPPRRNIT